MFSEFEDPDTLVRFVEWLRIEVSINPAELADVTDLIERFCISTSSSSRAAGALSEWISDHVSKRWQARWKETITGKRLPLPENLQSAKGFIEFLAMPRANCMFLYHEFDKKFLSFVEERSAFFHKRSAEWLNVFQATSFIRHHGGSELRDILLGPQKYGSLPALCIWSKDINDRHLVSLFGLNHEQVIDCFDAFVGDIRSGLDFDQTVIKMSAYSQLIRDTNAVKYIFHTTVSGQHATVMQGIEGGVTLNLAERNEVTEQVRSVIKHLAETNQSSLSAADQAEFSKHLKAIAAAKDSDHLSTAKQGWLEWFKRSGGKSLQIAAVTSDVVTLSGATGITGLGEFVLKFLGLG